MKRFSVAVIVLCTLALGFATRGHASVEVNVKVPVEGEGLFVVCANDGQGETIVLNGFVHLLITFTINENSVSGQTLVHNQGVTAVGSVTGQAYQIVGGTHDEFKATATNGHFETTFVNNVRVVGRGEAENFMFHETVHLTGNTEGEIVAEVVNTKVSCR
jgi:phosphotransferase system IIB component